MVERALVRQELLTRNHNFWRIYADLQNPQKGYGVWYDLAIEEAEKQRARIIMANANLYYEKEFGREISIQPVNVRFGVKSIFYDPYRIMLINVPAEGRLHSIIQEYEQQQYVLVDHDFTPYGDIFFVDPNAGYLS